MFTTEDETKVSWLFRFLVANKREYAIYGAGKYARQMLHRLRELNVPLPGLIVDDNPSEGALEGIPVVATGQFKPAGKIEIVLGTDTHQASMRQRLGKLFGANLNLIDIATVPALPPIPDIRKLVAQEVDNYRRLASLQNKHKGERIFVIGNGPSLKITDLDRLKNERTFGTNRIYLAFDQTAWRPSYYYADHVEVALDETEQINSIGDQTVKLFPFRIRKGCARIRNPIFFEGIWDVFEPNRPRFSTDPFAGLYWGSTVIYFMLQLAGYMGFSEIYLIGLDCSFNYPAEYQAGDKKFTIAEETRHNHFIENYVPIGAQTFPANVHRHFLAFEAAREEFERLGVKIRNATRGGKLEVFERVNFDDLF